MRVEMEYLAQRVHAGVCATGALGLDRVRRNLRKSRVDGILDSATRRLSLPAAEVAAVILESKGDTHRLQGLVERWGK